MVSRIRSYIDKQKLLAGLCLAGIALVIAVLWAVPPISQSSYQPARPATVKATTTTYSALSFNTSASQPSSQSMPGSDNTALGASNSGSMGDSSSPPTNLSPAATQPTQIEPAPLYPLDPVPCHPPSVKLGPNARMCPYCSGAVCIMPL